jgi:hypothetical protein
MKVTKAARTSPRDAAVGSTNAPAGGKINHTAKDETRASPATQRGPKVLQSHQARQRSLQFSRG